MAIIAISRQVATLGDEICQAVAQKLGYRFFTRQEIEHRLVELGFPEKNLHKYDERKPGFFASLSKDRDEYLNYLQLAILEAANAGDCILIGRGAFVILEDVPNLISLRFVAKDSIRLKRLQDEFNWSEKQAQARINESDTNRKGFHKSFFNVDNEDSTHYLLTINTGVLEMQDIIFQIENLAKYFSAKDKEAAGKKRIQNMLKAQDLTNKLLFEHRLNINFLHADINEEGDVITLKGVADSQGIVDRAVTLAAKILPSCEIKQEISIVQDFRKK